MDTAYRTHDDGLSRRTRDAAMDVTALRALVDRFDRDGLELNSFMVWHDSAVVAEQWRWPYRPELPHMLHSATKSFAGAAIGFAVQEGLMSLDDTIGSFFPGRPLTQPHQATMTIESLLTQTSGHAWGVSGSDWRQSGKSWLTQALDVATPFPQGKRFAYSSATSYLLSAALTSVTGMTAEEFLRPRLFDPLNFGDYRWDVDAEGVNPGGNGLATTTADLLKLGVLHLQLGQWEGDQLLAADWVAEATRPQHGNKYGYHWRTGPDGIYFASGMFGQYCFVLPKQQAVVAMTGGMPDYPHARAHAQQLVFDAADALFPDVRNSPNVDGPALPSDVRLLGEVPSSSSPRSSAIGGQTYRCEPNAFGIDTLRLDFTPHEVLLTVSDAAGAHQVRSGLGDWVESQTTLPGARLHHQYDPGAMNVVAGAEWLSDDFLSFQWQFIDTGFRDVAALSFLGEHLHFDRGVTVNSGAMRMPTVKARRES